MSLNKLLSFMFFSFSFLIFFQDIHAADICVDTATDEAIVSVADCSASCGTVAPFCSLREAITKANLTSAADRIIFGIPGSAPHTISLNTLLPPVTNPLMIDGLNGTELLAGSAPSIILQSGAVAANTGLDIQASNTTIAGIQVLHFSDDGIRIAGASSVQNVVVGPSNVISGNGEGIRIGENTDHITVKGNLIGTDPSGSSVMGNQGGITLTNVTHDDVIGGPLPGDGNVISGTVTYGAGYGGVGISIGVFSHHNIIQNNKIGTDITGTLALPNQKEGIKISHGGSQNQVGPNNLISGNASHGILMVPLPFSFDSTGNKIIGNKIGTARNGIDALGNDGSGIYIDGDSPAPVTHNHVLQTQIGGTVGVSLGGSCTGECNVIAFNHGDGIYLANTNQDSILSNSIYSNVGSGLHLNSANNDQVAPTISDATLSGSVYHVNGAFTGLASTEHTIQLFANDTCDASAGEAKQLLATGNFTTDASGNGSFSLDLNVMTGTVLTASSTDNILKNTSSFSSCFNLPAAPTTPSATGGSDTGSDTTSSGRSGGCSLQDQRSVSVFGLEILCIAYFFTYCWMRRRLALV